MKGKRLLAFLLATILTVLFGRWALGLFTVSEYVHFSINFPTRGGFEQLPLDDLPSPWSRVPEKEWNGYPAGGLLVWGREGEVVVDLGRRGWIKKLLQPGALLLSTHWLRNVGTVGRRVHLDLSMCGFDVTWVTFEADWDPDSCSSTRKGASRCFWG